MCAMEIAEHLAQLESDGPRLLDAAEQAGWDAPVPCTEWTVRDLVVHTGGIHRWATDIVRTGARSADTEARRAVGIGPLDGALLDWFGAGHLALVDALRAAPDDLDCVAFLPAPSPLAFWARRQAHETAIHRADAQAAAGLEVSFPIEFAQDGIAEMLRGFAARKSNAIDTDATLGLRPSDGSPPWLITMGGEQIEAVVSDADADALVAGSSTDLYLWLWNRPSHATISGDESTAQLWRSVRVRWA
jgi:uncharacterized protein (TIGR03083 family)